MDSQLTGSNELLYVQTEKVSVTIKGKATHPNFQGIEHKNGDSSIKVHCVDDFQMTLRDGDVPRFSSRNGEISTGIYSIYPMFYEQQQYEIVIEAVDGHKVAFWHDNLNVRNKVTRASRNHEILSGVINFGNEIGFSDLVIQIDGVNYLRLVIEVFPTKIDYQNDYKQIVEDVTKEVYNVVFDFLKKTYLGYQQSEKVNSSPVEFFAVINKIYKDFIKAADTIMSQPHHVLDTTHQVLPSHKVKKTDGRTIRWIKKHPDQAKRVNGEIRIERALAVRKQVSYDTKENQLTKYILLSTARKLESFKKNYLKLQRKEDQAVIAKIDGMVRELNRRCNTTFLADVEAKEASSGMSLVFSMAPGYRDLYKYYLMLLRGLSITGDVFNISVKDLALLYEYWCFIKLNSMMKDRYELISQDIVKVQGNGLFVSLVKGSSSKVKYRNSENGEVITLSYNPINIFGREAGIRYYGEVTKTSAVKRRDIREIPKNSDEAYYRFEIKEWKELNIPLVAKEVRDFPFFTNMFLLQHCPDVPDLHISSEEEYRLYIEVRRLANDASVNETDAEPGFKYDDKTIIMENGDIVVLKDGTKIEQISIETFMRKPRESMRVIAK